MSATLYREFRISSPGAWDALVAFVKQNAKAFADRGTPLRVIVSAEERKRTLEQNRFYWGPVLTTIAECAWVDGQQFRKESWHEYFADLYAPKVEIVLPFGELKVRRMSTSEMNVGEFTTYVERVQVAAAIELGVDFDT